MSCSTLFDNMSISHVTKSINIIDVGLKGCHFNIFTVDTFSYARIMLSVCVCVLQAKEIKTVLKATQTY